MVSERAHLPIDLRLDGPAAQYGRITKVSAKCVQMSTNSFLAPISRGAQRYLRNFVKSCNIVKHTLLRNHSDLMDIFYSFVFLPECCKFIRPLLHILQKFVAQKSAQHLL